MKGNAILLLIGGISLMMVFALTYPSIIAAHETIYSTSYYTDFTLSNIEHDVESDNCTFRANVTYNHGGQNASYVVAGNAFNATIGAQNDWIWNIRDGVDYPTLAMEYAGFPRGSIPVGAVEISNVTELQAMSSNLSANYVLMNDIDASGASEWNPDGSGGYYGFDPIGDLDTPFTGTFDGRGYEISDLYINRPSTDYVGLFGYATGTYIRNFEIRSVNITGNGYVGGVCGLAIDLNELNNVSVSGDVVGNGNRVGGLAGRTWNSVRVKDSYSTANVTGVDRVGGAIGHHTRSSIIENIYSTGSVIGALSVGGLIGSTFDNTQEINSYWNTETSGLSTSAGGEGKTTAEMRDIDTYTTWDIVEVDEYTVPVISVSITIDYTVDGRVCTITFTDTVHNNTATYIVITVTYHDEYLSLILQLALAGIVVIGVVYAAMEVLS